MSGILVHIQHWLLLYPVLKKDTEKIENAIKWDLPRITSVESLLTFMQKGFLLISYIWHTLKIKIDVSKETLGLCTFWLQELKHQVIGDRRNSVYAWTLKVWERKLRVGRAKHSSEKGSGNLPSPSPSHDCVLPFPSSLFSLILLEFKHKLNFVGPLFPPSYDELVMKRMKKTF